MTEEKAQRKLLPCPFCNAPEKSLHVTATNQRTAKMELRYGPAGNVVVTCTSCGANGPASFYGKIFECATLVHAEEIAINSWNLRGEVFLYAMEAVKAITEAYIENAGKK